MMEDLLVYAALAKANKAGQGGGSDLALLRLSGDVYLFEEGMTWEQWCDSRYNTCGAYCDGARVCDRAGDLVAEQQDTQGVFSVAEIDPGTIYVTL